MRERNDQTAAKVRVLIVDDSAVFREYLYDMFEDGAQFTVCGVATNGAEALEVIARQRPDVVVMDVKMPVMDGFETTRRIMSTDPIPIVILSASLETDEVQLGIFAMEAGALAAFHKPPGPNHPNQPRIVRQLKSTVRALAQVKLVTRRRANGVVSAPAIMSLQPRRRAAVVAVGASTGGPPAVQKMLAALQPGFPLPILLVQHICPGFTEGFANWLGENIVLPVHLAADGEKLVGGHVYVAPDNYHLTVAPNGRIVLVRPVRDTGHCPAIAELFASVACVYGAGSIGVLMTGMGVDGAAELKQMRDAGGTTIIQNEATCVVFGMPGEALRLDAAMHVLPPEEIGIHLAHLSLTANSVKERSW